VRRPPLFSTNDGQGQLRPWHTWSEQTEPRWLAYAVAVVACLHMGSIVLGVLKGGFYLWLAGFGAVMLAVLVVLIGIRGSGSHT